MIPMGVYMKLHDNIIVGGIDIKQFKKCLSVLIAVLVIFGAMAPVQAANGNDCTLYAYSCDVSTQEEYAASVVSQFIYSHGYEGEVSNLELGKGIIINDEEEIEKVLFPIWEDNTIVATFLVSFDGDACYGSFSEIYAQQLNALQNVATVNSPLVLVVQNDTIYAVISTKWYDLNGGMGEYVIGEEYGVLGLQPINARNAVVYDEYIQPRIPTAYAKTFTIYQTQSTYYCYAYALGNMLMNMGYTSYTPANIISYMNSATGATQPQMASYLESKGLSCTYSRSGYLSFSAVQNILYNGNGYIYMNASNNDANTAHIFVLIGYANTGSEQLYTIWNPWYTYKQTISASTRYIPTESTKSYTWDNGYLYNIR